MRLFLADGYRFPGIQPQLAPDEHNSWKVGGINWLVSKNWYKLSVTYQMWKMHPLKSLLQVLMIASLYDSAFIICNCSWSKLVLEASEVLQCIIFLIIGLWLLFLIQYHPSFIDTLFIARVLRSGRGINHTNNHWLTHINGTGTSVTKRYHCYVSCAQLYDRFTIGC